MMCRGSSACVINAFAEGSEVDIGDIGKKGYFAVGYAMDCGYDAGSRGPVRAL
jgi:hypothetical protein